MSEPKSTSSKPRLIPVILAGGAGTRLWPLSRQSYPKQFLSLGDDLSLLQKTIHRIKEHKDYDAPIILTQEDYRFLVAEQLRLVGVDNATILLEPAMHNTAPALCALAHFIAASDPEAILHIMPSDHEIIADDTYWSSLERGYQAALQNFLITFGITPTSAKTGYGYIHEGESLMEGVYKVNRFIEKPILAKAQEMLTQGGYFWNAGMFMFKAQSFLDEMQHFSPELFDTTALSVKKARPDLDFIRLDQETYVQSPSISIDYALFEKTDKAAVVPCPIEWSDLGTWHAVWEHHKHCDPLESNVAFGQTTLHECENVLAISDGPHIALQGLRKMCVIASDDAVYVGSLEKGEGVKSLVQKLKENPDTASLVAQHRTMYRPWGGYSSVLNGTRFQVKRLFVKPGCKLSLQMHHHRAEHWIVVKGTAEVTINDRKQLLMENQSVYIPQSATHRLANPGKIMLELIEVQSGSYLGEDDIVRLEDDFNRPEKG